MKTMLRLSVAVLLLASVARAQTNAPAVWTPELQLKVRAVGSPRVSPDGRRVVYTVSDAVTNVVRQTSSAEKTNVCFIRPPHVAG